MKYFAPDILLSSLKEHELLAAIKDVHYLLTQQREDLAKIYETPELVSAYAYFYLPAYIDKWQYLLTYLKTDNLPSQGKWIDFGCGPGTTFLGLKENSFFSSWELVGFDKAIRVLEQAKKLQNEEQNTLWTTSSAHLQKTDILSFSHSLNELPEDLVKSTIQKTNPEKVLWLEPGTKESFRHILTMRTWLIEQGYYLEYPCPSTTACPLDGDSNWCHQVLYTKVDPKLERICQILKIDHKRLPFIGHIYSKKQIKSDLKRYIRLKNVTKYSFVTEICHQDNLYQVCEIPFKILSKNEKKNFRSLAWGSEFQGEFEELKNGILRAKSLTII